MTTCTRIVRELQHLSSREELQYEENLEQYQTHQTLAYARATCSALYAEERLARKHVKKKELALRMLRDEVDRIQTKVMAADQHIGVVQDMLSSSAIPDIHETDNKDGGDTIYSHCDWLPRPGAHTLSTSDSDSEAI